MNSTHTPTDKVQKLAQHDMPCNYMLGERSMACYLRPNGVYAVRLYLPAGELSQNEVVYTYLGTDVQAARNAWRKTVTEWKALYAQFAQFNMEVAAVTK